MKKSVLVTVIGLTLMVPVSLVGYGYSQGLKMGESGSSKIAAGIVALSMNPLSQTGFKYGYQKGVIKKQELDEWSKEYFGPWVGWSSKDPITDFENYNLINKGDKGPYNESASLNLRCLNDKTEVYIKWGSYLIGDRDERLLVTHRIDSNKAITSNWLLSTDKKAFFYNGNDIGFIKSLIGKKTLVVQFDDRSTRTINFSLDKLDEEIKPLAQSCNWKV